VMYVALANIATQWMTFLESHQKTVGYIGSTLFICMGLFGLIKKFKPKKPNREQRKMKISTGAYFQIFLSGFLMNSLNPGVVITWVGAVAMLAGPTVEVSHRLVLFGV